MNNDCKTITVSVTLTKFQNSRQILKNHQHSSKSSNLIKISKEERKRKAHKNFRNIPIGEKLLSIEKLREKKQWRSQVLDCLFE